MSDQDRGRAAGRLLPWVAGLVLPALVVTAFFTGRGSPSAEADDPAATGPVLVEMPPVLAGTVVPARLARLRPTARVIGVTVGGLHRAYVVSTLIPIRRHVINDHLGKATLAVAYCDKTDCASAYTVPDSTPEVAVGGWDESGPEAGMLLRIGRHRYRQKSGQPFDEPAPPFPLTGVEVERTTWGEWQAAHPDTDVYVGGGADATDRGPTH